jgi:hypothetical protein
MKRNFLLTILFVCLGIMFMASDCEDHSSSNVIEAAKQEALKKEADRQAGMPSVHNFTMKKQLKAIIELCDQTDLICYAYVVPEMTGKPVFLCKCIGFGIPYATQYTNPSKEHYFGNHSATVLPQADPDGLYKPANAEGTWLMAINPKDGSIRPMYVEPRVLVSTFPLTQQ